MGTYTVTHNCGHTGDVKVYGKVSGRDYQVAKAADNPCATCRQAAQTAKNAAAAAEAAKIAAQAGLPVLTGSDKQIVWAEQIRREKLESLQNLSELIDLVGSKERASQLTEAEKAALGVESRRILAKMPADKRANAPMQAYATVGVVVTAEGYPAAMATLKAQSKASWWIDHRATDIAELLK